MPQNIVPADEAQMTEFLKAASAKMTELGVPQEYHQDLLTNELAAQAANLSIPSLKQAAMEKEVESPCDALAGIAEDSSDDKKKPIAKKSVKITVLKKAMADAKENKGKTPEEKKDEEVNKGIPVKTESIETSEKVAREALFNSALDHMVNEMQIPEKQAKEILVRQYGEI
jgi:hypothetical protein